ncbi:MAG: outer membrane beta-barrel protein [Thiohalomonadales bacterium]
MKRGTLLLFILLSAIYASPVLSAAGDKYILPKFGIMSIDLKNADPLISFGVMLGFGLSVNFSFELEYNIGFSGGDYEETVLGDPANIKTGFYRVDTGAGYLVYRHPISQKSYFKTKLGLLYENVERTESGTLNPEITDVISSNDTGVAGGLGIGWYVGERLTLDVEMTVIDKDIIFYSLGTHYRF